jgi:hypothetical protein
MTISREQLLSAALIAGAILAHAYITQPSHYQFLSRTGSLKVIRGDTRTGKLIECDRDVGPDGNGFYGCPLQDTSSGK